MSGSVPATHPEEEQAMTGEDVTLAEAIDALRLIAQASDQACSGVPLCQTCGEIHEYIPPGHPIEGAPGHMRTATGSWASPVDGHSLRRTRSSDYAGAVLSGGNASARPVSPVGDTEQKENRDA